MSGAKSEGGGWLDGGESKRDAKETAEAKPKKRRPRRAYDDAEENEERGNNKDRGSKGGDRSPRVRKHVEEGWGVGAPERKSRFNEDGEDEDGDGPGDEGDSGKSRRRTMADDGGGGEEMTEILIIPDLDEQLEEDITMQVAEAPRNRSRKPPPLHELDADLVVTPSATSPAARSAGGGGGPAKGNGALGRRIDLSALSCRLVPPALVQEDDAPWSFDSLLQSVTQEFIADAEADEALKAETAAAKKREEEEPPPEPRRKVLGGRRAERPEAASAAPISAAPPAESRERASRPRGGGRGGRPKANAADGDEGGPAKPSREPESKGGDDDSDDDIQPDEK